MRASVCLCLSVAACPHYYTDPDATWRNGTGSPPLSCALLGGFAIGHGFRCYDNIARTRNVSECLYSLYAWFHMWSDVRANLSALETRHRASTSMYSLTFLRSRYVARRPPVEARSPDCRSNVENAPRRRLVTGKPATRTSHIRRAILRTPPVTRQSPASSVRRPRPDGRSHYVVISRDGRKLVTRVRVMLP